MDLKSMIESLIVILQFLVFLVVFMTALGLLYQGKDRIGLVDRVKSHFHYQKSFIVDLGAVVLSVSIGLLFVRLIPI